MQSCLKLTLPIHKERTTNVTELAHMQDFFANGHADVAQQRPLFRNTTLMSNLSANRPKKIRFRPLYMKVATTAAGLQ
jgi:hypothetical protein